MLTVSVVVPIPILPSINTCMTLTASTSTTTMASTLPEINTTQLHQFAEVCSTVTESLPTLSSPIVMNSLVSPTKIVKTELPALVNHIALPEKIPISSLPPASIPAVNDSISNNTETSLENNVDSLDIPFQNNEADLVNILTTEPGKEDIEDASVSVEPMDEEILNSPKDPPKISNEDIQMREETPTQQASPTGMQVETNLMNNQEIVDVPVDNAITIDDLLLLCDLFYLPFEHGAKAIHLLNEFQWLKSNAHTLVAHKNKSVSDSNEHLESQEWNRRANAFQNLCNTIFELTRKIAFCENRELCYDLYTYVWEVSSVTSLLSAFVQWLGLGKFPSNIQAFTQGNYTYFSKGWKEAFTSGNNEPWVCFSNIFSIMIDSDD